MAKQSGLGDNLYIGGVNVGADINSIGSLSTPREVLPATAITQSAMARLFGKRDGQAEFTAYFNPAASGTHEHLSSLPTADTQLYYARGTTLGNEAFVMNCKQIGYDPNRGDDGSLLFGVAASANAYGADWCKQLTAGVRSDSSATNGTGVDFGTGSTTFGLIAYLQVFSFTGTDVTIKIQESSDNSGDAYADVTGGSFGAQTGAGFSRISTASNLTVERYLRVVTTTSGGFSAVSFAVAVYRPDVAWVV